MMACHRIAVGGIFTECNQFGGAPIDMRWFERYDLCRGEEILQLDSGVVGGMLQVLGEREVEVAPLLYAGTCPGGALTVDCYRQLKTELLIEICEKAGMPANIRFQDGYDHSYYFISTFMAEHVAWHARHLKQSGVE